MHVKHGKCIFVPQGEYSRMRTINLNLMMQKGSRVVQMIIAHKSFLNFYILKDERSFGSGTQYSRFIALSPMEICTFYA